MGIWRFLYPQEEGKLLSIESHSEEFRFKSLLVHDLVIERGLHHLAMGISDNIIYEPTTMNQGFGLALTKSSYSILNLQICSCII